MFHVELPKATIMVPIQWQLSVPKLLAEFASISYLTWDLTQMETPDAGKEFLRRLKAIATKKRVVIDDVQHTIYSTPQPGFFSENMPTFNDIVIDAIACPPTLATYRANKLQIHGEMLPTHEWDLQWTSVMDKIRIYDHVTTEMLKFEVADLLEFIGTMEKPPFGEFDQDWLASLTDQEMAVRILYQVRPVILDANFARVGDIYVRQAVNAFDDAKVCSVGTLEELEKIRQGLPNKNSYRGRFNRRNHGKRPFYFGGMNIQQWRMPNNRSRPWYMRNNFNEDNTRIDPIKTLTKDKVEEIEISDDDEKTVATNPTIIVNCDTGKGI